MILFSLAALIGAQDSNIQDVQAALMNSSVIPDVLPSNFTPVFPIEVVFPQSGGSDIPVTAGMNLTMAETANMPFFAIQSTNTMIIGKPYLMAIVDPDAPSPPNRTRAQFLHFLGANYVSNNLTDNEVFILSNTSEPIMPFVMPTPPNGSVPHRYTVAMYLQTGGNVTAANGTIPADRTNFNLTTFAQETGNLTLLGATFFLVGPGNTTANNSIMGNASLSSILSSPSATTAPGAGGGNTTSGGTDSGPGGSGGGGGGAARPEMVAPIVWSALALLFGVTAYMI